MLRDEIENFCLHSRASRRDQEERWKKCTFFEGWRPFFSPDIKDTRDFNKDSLKYKYITQFPLLEFGSMRPSTAWVVNEKYWPIRSLIKIIFLNFCFHFCQNVTFQQDNVWGGWKWKWLLKVWSKLGFRLLRFPAKPFKPVYTDILKPSHTHLTIKI